MRLGEFIEQLANCENTAGADTPVKFSDGSMPGAFYSHRGWYEHLTLAPEWQAREVTVGWLLDAARECVGKVFQGYKGGDFLMSAETPLWADAWGENTHYAVFGVGWNPSTNVVVIERKQIADEYLY